MRKNSLTSRFFVLFGAVQAAAVISISIHAVFAGFLLSLFALVITALWDRRSLPAQTGYDASAQLVWESAAGAVLGSPVKIVFRLKGRDYARLLLRPPRLKTLEVRRRGARYTRIPADSRTSGAFVCEFDAVAYRLGYETLCHVQYRGRSRLGLWVQAGDLSVPPVVFRVVPTQKEISSNAFQQVVSQQAVFFHGNRRVMRGTTAELFHSVRKFQGSDPLRHIDHKKSAKYGQWMTRTYESLLNHHLVLALDLGRSLTGQLGQSNKVDYYLSVCLSLAKDALRNSDHVSFVAFSRKIHYVINQTKRFDSFLPLYEGHPAIAPLDQETDWELLPKFLQGASGHKNLVLLFTDAARPSVQNSLLQVVPTLCKSNLVVVVSLADSEYLLDSKLSLPGQILNEDTYANLLYSYWLDQKTSLFRSTLSQYGAGAVSISEKDWLSAVRKTYELMRVSSST